MTTQVLVDPSLPAEVFALIETSGYDVQDARAMGLTAAGIETVWQTAIEIERTLLTARWHSEGLPDLQGTRTPGLVIFRFPPHLDDAAIATNVLEFLQCFSREDWRDRSALITLESHEILPPIPRSDYVEEPTMLG